MLREFSGVDPKTVSKADLVAICIKDVHTKTQRTKFETLVTVHVHQKDLFQEVWKKVKEGKVKDLLRVQRSGWVDLRTCGLVVSTEPSRAMVSQDGAFVTLV